MNFFDVTLTTEEEELLIQGEAFRAKVPPQHAERLRPFVGREIVLGLRPEDIHAQEYQPPGIAALPLRARVDVTELMGNETFLYLLVGDKQFLARVDPRTKARPGQDTDLVLNMANMHAFDSNSQQALLA